MPAPRATKFVDGEAVFDAEPDPVFEMTPVAAEFVPTVAAAFGLATLTSVA
jgi:hypothetical protein